MDTLPAKAVADAVVASTARQMAMLMQKTAHEDGRDCGMISCNLCLAKSLMNKTPLKSPPRNGPCMCQSGKKYKHCCRR